MSGFGKHHGGPVTDSDDRRLDQVNDLIAQAQAYERAQAARLAEEARLRAQREAERPALTLEHLLTEKARLEAVISLRDHHLQRQQERELLDRKIASLQQDAAQARDTLTATEGELAAAIDLRLRLQPQ